MNVFSQQSVSNVCQCYLAQEIEHYLFRSWYEFEIFSVCSEKVVQSIMTYIQKEIYVSGDEICRIGDVCTCIYFVKIGTISFYNSSLQKVGFISNILLLYCAYVCISQSS